jgi:hypothetical protein
VSFRFPVALIRTKIREATANVMISLLEKPPVVQLFKKLSSFLWKPQGSLPCSQEPATDPHRVTLPFYLFKVRLILFFHLISGLHFPAHFPTETACLRSRSKRRFQYTHTTLMPLMLARNSVGESSSVA